MNYNFEIFELVKNSEDKSQNRATPIEMLRAGNSDPNSCVFVKYEEVTIREIQEQLKIIFQIARNLIFIPENQEFIFQQKGILNFILDMFSSILDEEIRRNCLEIVSVLCKFIILENLTPSRSENLM